jgi:hypothetical protein
MRQTTIAVAAVLVAAATGCGHSSASPAAVLRAYIRAVEPIRLGVNELLDTADPVLDAYRERRIDADQAAAAIDRLERRFAEYTVQVNALQIVDPSLARVHRPYAHTYILEDAYLSALASALPGGDFSDLPSTQASQRASIVEWRSELTVLAERRHVRLPADLQQAGRGEIAPSPTGS